MKQRIVIVARGAVQGVGFRPFVYRLSAEMHLPGWVSNSPSGVFVEAEGEKEVLDTFLLRLQNEIPPRASIQSLEFSFLDPVGYDRFTIRESEQTGEPSALVLPDIATCPDCLSDITDPSNRRYRYPFTNCTNCGPRYSIIRALPYDRGNTTMSGFQMCPACEAEYADPADRRFHAQPNACPVCGPRLQLWDRNGRAVAELHAAVTDAAEAIRTGRAVALKGIGGFHLIVDARNSAAVGRLRTAKHREEKPFALMFPTADQVEEVCRMSDLERRLFHSPESPIVLLRRREETGTRSLIAPEVAPGNPSLGAMLPSTPLHHLLMRELGFPVVATSGNISDEPICTDEREALHRLAGIADLFLVHDRPIFRHVDDSVVRVMLGRELVLRRARGYAPLPVRLRHDIPDTLAVGPHLKNTVAVARGRNAFLSQHLGDLETKESLDAFAREITSLQSLYRIRPSRVVSDLHPDYLSTKYARGLGLPLLAVQHHFAHIASCMAENDLEGEVLGVSWDGTGYGPDGTIWGGEFLVTTPEGFRRTVTLRTFLLPGGEAAVKEPRRSALGMLTEAGGPGLIDRTAGILPRLFSDTDLRVLQTMMERRLNSPATSSAGRMFDAVASILGLRQRCAFEGQAAMELEFLADGTQPDGTYDFTLTPGTRTGVGAGDFSPEWIIDWGPMLLAIIDDVAARVPGPIIASRFHATLAKMIVNVACRSGIRRIVLSGGCFQNRILTELSVTQLQKEGFHPYWHQRVPPNDGGIALGQLNAAAFAQSLPHR